MNELSKEVLSEAPTLFRQATNIADLCREMVKKTAVRIGKKNYVPVEAWTAIAVAHGCIATIKEGSVAELANGVRAVAEIRRQSDGAILTSAEGFVGKDEILWFGGTELVWHNGREVENVVVKRADYAIRAMAQTRAISRACRTAFSHVVVLIDKELSTTPYEEVATVERLDAEPPATGATEPKKEAAGSPAPKTETAQGAKQTKAPEVPRDETLALRKKYEGGLWKDVHFHFGKNGPAENPPDGLSLGQIEEKSLVWWHDNWQPRPNPRDGSISQKDLNLRAAIEVGYEESVRK